MAGFHPFRNTLTTSTQLHGPEYEHSSEVDPRRSLAGSRRGADGAQERRLRSTGGPPVAIKASGMIVLIMDKQHT